MGISEFWKKSRTSRFPAASYKQVIENSYRVFTVFTGAAFSFYVTELFTKDEPAWRFLIMPAAIALLLRYIVGSAVHLNNTYASEQKDQPSNLSLFFDILVLVAFGYLAIFIIRADSVAGFIDRAILFVLAGFVWSFFACFRGEQQRTIGKIWLLIDGLQAVFALFILFLPYIAYSQLSIALDDSIQSILITFGFVVFLYFDLYYILKWPGGKKEDDVRSDMIAAAHKVFKEAEVGGNVAVTDELLKKIYTAMRNPPVAQ